MLGYIRIESLCYREWAANPMRHQLKSKKEKKMKYIAITIHEKDFKTYRLCSINAGRFIVDCIEGVKVLPINEQIDLCCLIKAKELGCRITWEFHD